MRLSLENRDITIKLHKFLMVFFSIHPKGDVLYEPSVLFLYRCIVGKHPAPADWFKLSPLCCNGVTDRIVKTHH